MVKSKLLRFRYVFIFFAETFHPTGGIDKFLLTGKKRMAVGTNLHAYFISRGPGGIGGAAGTGNGQLFIFRMNA